FFYLKITMLCIMKVIRVFK
ncbi:hypothetical protein A5849_001519, partial [Enterococcus sp. 10F3_DIV0382]